MTFKIIRHHATAIYYGLIETNRPVFYKEFRNIGINYIQDLFVDNSANLSFNYWKNNGLSNKSFLKFCGLRSAVMWGHKQPNISNEFEQSPPSLVHFPFLSNCDKIPKTKSHYKAKHFYQFLMKSRKTTWPTSSKKIIEDFSLANNEELSSFYNLTYRVTRDTKLRDLQ